AVARSPTNRIEPGRASSLIVPPASALSSAGIGSDGRALSCARTLLAPDPVTVQAAPARSTVRRENCSIISSVRFSQRTRRRTRSESRQALNPIPLANRHRERLSGAAAYIRRRFTACTYVPTYRGISDRAIVESFLF